MQLRRRAFTLIELLVTLAIIILLAGLLAPGLAKGTNLAKRAACLSNLRQIGVGTALYLNDHHGLMPAVPDLDLHLTPPVNASGKRYASMGAFMPLLHPYLADSRVWECPPAPVARSNSWKMHFSSPWREQGVDRPELAWANYLSDKLAELDHAQARYLRGRSPESVALKRGSSLAQEEWLMSPFFERSWWDGFRAAWTVGDSVPPRKGWSAHNGGRNQLCLDLHVEWVRRDIER